MTQPIADPLAVPLKAAKEKNYTDAQVAELNTSYPAYPTRETVKTLAKSFGKTERSVIAKLSNMGIYVTPKRTTKQGTPIVKKSTLVENIGILLEINVPSLEKSNKQDLEKLLSAVEDWTGTIDEVAPLV